VGELLDDPEMRVSHEVQNDLLSRGHPRTQRQRQICNVSWTRKEPG
jgi:hypothetical protein